MKIARLLFLSLPLLGGLAVGRAAARPVEPQCVQAENWVEEHRADLPTSLVEISELQIAYRKAVISALPITQRAALWREQFQFYLRNGEFSAAGRAFLEEAGQKVEVFLLASESSEGKDIPGLEEFGQEAITLFGREQAAQMFANIGVDTPEVVAPLRTDGSGECSCNNGSANWCGNVNFWTCQAGDPPCTTTAHGCGWLLVQECNGICAVS